MDDGIEFNESAFKHGISKENILHALKFPEYEGPLENDCDKYIVIGFDKSGKLLEILYNRIDDNTINVFHAMKFRNIFLYLLDV
jgi:hypothetical protein